MYQTSFLALQHPTFPHAPLNGQFLLITGASTAVGSNAIQLARASGYQVVTTCSPHNFSRAEYLGASYAMDYNSPTLEDDLTAVLQGKGVAGAFAIGPGSVELCVGVLGRLGPSCRKFVVKASFPWPKEDPKSDEEYWSYMKWVDDWNQTISQMAEKAGVKTKSVEGAALGLNEVSKSIYDDFLPQALAGGGYIAAPDPFVVGNGLEYIQQALTIQKDGVSAKKIVVTI